MTCKKKPTNIYLMGDKSKHTDNENVVKTTHKRSKKILPV